MEEMKNVQKPNLKRYLARVGGSGAFLAYGGRFASSATYAGGGCWVSLRLCSCRLSCVREEEKVYPKKSSVGFKILLVGGAAVRETWRRAEDGVDSEVCASMAHIVFL
jgi:hypothetical protein